jgi:hypothetical protein
LIVKDCTFEVPSNIVVDPSWKGITITAKDIVHLLNRCPMVPWLADYHEASVEKLKKFIDAALS